MITHISEQNNTPELAVEAVRDVLVDWPGHLGFATQQNGFDWLQLRHDEENNE